MVHDAETASGTGAARNAPLTVETSNGPTTVSRFQILSLDGGGIRGVFSAAVLASIEEDCDIRVTDCFDLIAGTSTGGILAIGLGLGYSPKEMVEFYVACGPQIFKRGSLGLFGTKYPATQLSSVLKAKFGERTFGESKKRLVVPSFNLGDNEVCVFRTAHLERLRRDYRLPAWHVAMATAAAPTYFPVHRMPDHVRLVDGGVWANNPAMVALVEAVGKRHLAIPIEHVNLLSLGTMSALRGRRAKLDRGGKLAWAKAGVDVLLDASAIGVSNQANALLDDRFVRVDGRGLQNELKLDDTTTVAELIGAARHWSRSMMPQIAEQFLKYRAEPFVPWYQGEVT